MYKEEAIAVLLEAVSSEENCGTQALAAHIISNLAGTHSWGGESYTAAWLLKKAGLVSTAQRNMVRNIDWFDPCLQVQTKKYTFVYFFKLTYETIVSLD